MWPNHRQCIISTLSGGAVGQFCEMIGGKITKMETSSVLDKGADAKLSNFPMFWG